MKTLKLKKTFSLLAFSAMTFAAAQVTALAQPCVQPAAVYDTSWTKLKEAIPSGNLLEGTYDGEGKTSHLNYKLHLLQYMESRDSFVAVIENEQLSQGTIGFVKLQGNGTYLWYTVRANGGINSQLEVKLDYAPVYKLSISYDEDARPHAIDMIVNGEQNGAETIQFKEARAPLMHRSLFNGKYKEKYGQAETQMSVVANRDEGGLVSPVSCTEPGYPGVQMASSWNVQRTDLSEGSGDATASFVGRVELPGLIGVRPVKYDGYVAVPSDGVTGVLVSIERKTKTFFIESSRQEILSFTLDERGFVKSVIQQLKIVR